jgi:hypothetical protein
MIDANVSLVEVIVALVTPMIAIPMVVDIPRRLKNVIEILPHYRVFLEFGGTSTCVEYVVLLCAQPRFSIDFHWSTLQINERHLGRFDRSINWHKDISLLLSWQSDTGSKSKRSPIPKHRWLFYRPANDMVCICHMTLRPPLGGGAQNRAG